MSEILMAKRLQWWDVVSLGFIGGHLLERPFPFHQLSRPAVAESLETKEVSCWSPSREPFRPMSLVDEGISPRNSAVIHPCRYYCLDAGPSACGGGMTPTGDEADRGQSLIKHGGHHAHGM